MKDYLLTCVGGERNSELTFTKVLLLVSHGGEVLYPLTHLIFVTAM